MLAMSTESTIEASQPQHGKIPLCVSPFAFCRGKWLRFGRKRANCRMELNHLWPHTHDPCPTLAAVLGRGVSAQGGGKREDKVTSGVWVPGSHDFR